MVLMEAECEGWGWLEEQEKVNLSAARTRYVHGRRGEDRQQCEELPKEGEIDKRRRWMGLGTHDYCIMQLATRDGLQQAIIIARRVSTFGGMEQWNRSLQSLHAQQLPRTDFPQL